MTCDELTSDLHMHVCTLQKHTYPPKKRKKKGERKRQEGRKEGKEGVKKQN